MKRRTGRSSATGATGSSRWGRLHFPGWRQILDFLHLLVHLYAAATAAYRGQGKLAWRLYEQMLRAAWAGQVDQVQADLNEQAARLGPPPPHARHDDPRKIVASSLAYVQKNADRMNYPQYRREGLPVTSAAVESLIKQFNQRVKGTEKFWLRGGAEAVLQGYSRVLQIGVERVLTLGSGFLGRIEASILIISRLISYVFEAAPFTRLATGIIRQRRSLSLRSLRETAVRYRHFPYTPTGPTCPPISRPTRRYS